jgi:hypothetical protein
MTARRLFRGRERAGIYGMRLQLMRHPLGGPWTTGRVPGVASIAAARRLNQPGSIGLLEPVR